MTSKVSHSTLALLAVALAAGLGGPVAAQQGLQPGSGAVRLVLNSAPGSAADAVARVMLEPLAEILGQPVVWRTSQAVVVSSASLV